MDRGHSVRLFLDSQSFYLEGGSSVVVDSCRCSSLHMQYFSALSRAQGSEQKKSRWMCSSNSSSFVADVLRTSPFCLHMMLQCSTWTCILIVIPLNIERVWASSRSRQRRSYRWFSVLARSKLLWGLCSHSQDSPFLSLINSPTPGHPSTRQPCHSQGRCSIWAIQVNMNTSTIQRSEVYQMRSLWACELPVATIKSFSCTAYNICCFCLLL
jgi:hypothetical protein